MGVCTEALCHVPGKSAEERYCADDRAAPPEHSAHQMPDMQAFVPIDETGRRTSHIPARFEPASSRIMSHSKPESTERSPSARSCEGPLASRCGAADRPSASGTAPERLIKQGRNSCFQVEYRTSRTLPPYLPRRLRRRSNPRLSIKLIQEATTNPMGQRVGKEPAPASLHERGAYAASRLSRLTGLPCPSHAWLGPFPTENPSARASESMRDKQALGQTATNETSPQPRLVVLAVFSGVAN